MSGAVRDVAAGRRVVGHVTVPGSKSITNRALVCAAFAVGKSTLLGGLVSDDTEAMIEGLRALGASIEVEESALVVAGDLTVEAEAEVNVGASGTTMRFLTAVAALGSRPIRLDGTPRMRERPIGSLVTALRSLGAKVTHEGAEGCPPITVTGPLVGTSTTVDASLSSQFVTALMLIGPVLDQGLTLELLGHLTSQPYVVTTAEVMRSFGASVTIAGRTIRVDPGGYRGTRFIVEPDASAAVYAWVGAAITNGSVTVSGLPSSSNQADMGVLAVLEQMGAVVDRHAEVTVRGTPTGLRGVNADLSDCPDGAMALAVAAATAVGESRFRGLHTLRLKETDRLGALESELRKIGAEVTTDLESITITPGLARPAAIDTFDDHRVAMSFGILGLRQPGVRILNSECVAKTWPQFWEALDAMAQPVVLPVIAIDGPAGTGKTTVADGVARALGGTRLDTGAFYRTATLLAVRAGVDVADGEAVAGLLPGASFDYARGTMRLNGEDVSTAIRSPSVNASVSLVAAHPEVRHQLVAQQRRWISRGDEIVVVEGRDIGTVVFPDAAVKVYLDARPEIRATRRALEAGTDPDEELARLQRRDDLDSTRATSPLRPAEDAWLIDTSDLRVDEVVAAIVLRYQDTITGAK